MNSKSLFLLASASMSLGWRIRGQFGHEVGAAMAGALVGLAVVVSSGRKDWLERAIYFAGLSALGWAFGGSMSYMKVVGYCHSSDPATVLYGFACLLLVGFLWAVPGGAAIALAGSLDAQKLNSICSAAAVVFAAWFLQDIAVDVLESRQLSLDWHGSDWLAASIAVVVAFLTTLLRRRLDFGVSLVLYLSVGWWVGFAGLVVVGGLHMNPPRGDNWAGCLGLVLGLLFFLSRNQLSNVLRASLKIGFVGAVGFALAQLVKLSILRVQWMNDPHPVMEWMHGAFFGVAVCIGVLETRTSTPLKIGQAASRASMLLMTFWILWIIPYYNFRKCTVQWLKQMPGLEGTVQGLPLSGNLVPTTGWIGWVEIVFLGWAVVLVSLSVRRNPAGLGSEQHGIFDTPRVLFAGLCVLFCFTSFSRDLTNFESGRELPIQVAITLHTLVCLLIAFWKPRTLRSIEVESSDRVSMKRLIVFGLIASLLTVGICTLCKEAMFRNEFAGGFYTDHIRFGPNNTNDRK